MTRTNPDREAVTKVALDYCAEIGWKNAQVSGMLEDGQGNYLVRIQPTYFAPAIRRFALLVEWTLTSRFEVTTEVDFTEYLRISEEIVRCGYCDKKVQRVDIFVGVCQECAEEGIEA